MPVVSAFAAERQRLHAPEREIESSGFQAPFEHPGRADAIVATLATDERFSVAEPPPAPDGVVGAVHDSGLVAFLESAWQRYQDEVRPVHDVVPDVFAMAALRSGMEAGRASDHVAAQLGQWCFETTTPLTKGTYAAARSAVDCAVAAADAVLGGAQLAYGLCRPPGHHAAKALYGGYCFFNNAAVAAAHLATAVGGRVAVLDVDFHHGNGTQQIFYERDDVTFVSLHGDPARVYPYHTGHADEIGSGRGSGFNRNLPLAAGTDDEGYLSALARALEALDADDPAIVVVSLGVDTYVGDPMCDLALTTEGMWHCGELVAGLGRPLVVLQEGGYADEALGANVRAWLRGAASAPHVTS